MDSMKAKEGKNIELKLVRDSLCETFSKVRKEETKRKIMVKPDLNIELKLVRDSSALVPVKHVGRLMETTKLEE